MMPDVHNAGDATSQLELDGLAGRIGCAYVKRGLSLPFHLREALKQWRGLSQDEIVAVLEKHFEDCRRFYSAGSGDQHFAMVRSAIGKAMDAKDLFRARVEPERPRRRRTDGARKVNNASGIPDLLLDDPRAVRLLRNRNQAPVERPSGLIGYEGAGIPISLEDDEA